MRLSLLSAVVLLVLAAPAAAQTPGDLGGGIAPPTTTQPTPPPSTPTTPPPTPPTKPTRGSVTKVLAGELAAGRIDQARHDRYKADYDAAIAERAKLPLKGGDKLCREQLSAVVKTVEAMARGGQLTPSRMDAVFLELKRNTEFWVKRPSIRSSQRTKFGDSELLFQHYPGEGLRLQPLGNWGKLNGLLTECRSGKKCERAKIRKLLDELVPLASQRAGYTTWEYFFPFGGGSPPWTSGLAQGTAIQALARASEFLGDPQYKELAAKALGIFQKSPPEGVRISSGGGSHYLIYSFAPRLRVLNGFLQAVTGLYDYAQLTGDPLGKELFEAGDRAAQREVGRYDTGKWSYYALPGKTESTYGYHALVTTFLDNLCERTKAGAYCATATKFHRYLSKRPREPERPLGPNLRCGARKA